MTRARQLYPRSGWPALLVLMASALAACGGGGAHQSKSSSTTAKTTAATKTQSRTQTRTAPPRSTTLAESVRGTRSTTFGVRATVKPGDAVLLRTMLPGSATKPQHVSIKLPAGPAKSLIVTVRSNGQKSSAAITSANGQPVTLVRLHYVCTLPPTPTFCPAQRTRSSSARAELTFSAPHTTPIVLQATVGPVTATPPPVRTASSSVVPAYTATELVETVTPQPAGAPPGRRPKTPVLHANAQAKPGDIAVLATHVAGTPVGAPQAVKVSVEQGPARSITVSAQVSGGTISKATLTSAGGSPISLVFPHYVCFVAPLPTFCPAQKIQAGQHRYTLTFLASPYTPAILLLATVRAG